MKWLAWVDAMYAHYESAGHLRSVPARYHDYYNVSLLALSCIAATVDGLTILISGVGSGLAYHWFAFGLFDGFYRYLAFSLVTAALFLLLMFAMGAYRMHQLLALRRQFLMVCLGELAILAFLALIIFLLGISEDFSRGTFVLFAISSFAGLAASRAIWVRGIPVAKSMGLLRPRRALLICNQDFPLELLHQELSDMSVVVTHILNSPENGSLDSWISKIDSNLVSNVNEIIVASRVTSIASLEPLLKELRSVPLPVRLILDQFTAGILSYPISMVGSMATLEVQRPPIALAELTLKRGFDIIVSLIALVTLAPIAIIAMIAIKLDSSGPVFFRQLRRGSNGEPFTILKFRSMNVMEDDDNIRQAIRHDTRVTRVGAYIRSASIDEIPQFWNVLLGHMSIVGPRPHAVAHDDHYDTVIAKYAFRRQVKPGITGWAQINGFRGETPTLSSMEGRVNHDLWYIHNWSFWLDLKIMARTLTVMADRGTAY